jgi:SAM-dependent methyltransferase
MHGGAIDWVVINTIKDGLEMPSGEEHLAGPIKNYTEHKIISLDYQPTFKRVLDMGSLDICGTMRNYKFLWPNKPEWKELIGCEEYIGIDLMSGPSVDIIMNSHNLQFSDNSFDMVLSLNCLEHDTDMAKTISEGARVMKPGGTFLISCPNEKSLDHHELGGGSQDIYNKIHREELEKMLFDSGLTIKCLLTNNIDHQANCTK